MFVLVVNAGSSSLKYQLFDTSKNTVLAKGLCERIGIDGVLEHKKADGTKIRREIAMPNHAVATKFVVEALTDPENGCIKDMSQIEAIGHRVVHGGPFFFESTLLTPEVKETLNKCIDLAPLHTKAHIMGIEGCSEVMPNVPQVLVFDTAFHQTMPAKAYTYPISYEMAEKYNIRRYGFHGTSHRYVSSEMIKILGKPASETKIITCHIGNGSSCSAVNGGKCVDTSMGFTPLDGLEMGTRCGSIDPAIVTFLMEKEGYSPEQMNNYMNKKCGFLGVSGVSSDSRDIDSAINEGNERAKLTLDVVTYQIKKYIGSYMAAMNGADAIVFTAGIGENSVSTREKVLEDLEFLGIELDKEANVNAVRLSGPAKISKDSSKVAVYVIPTNEELVIAQDTEDIVSKL